MTSTESTGTLSDHANPNIERLIPAQICRSFGLVPYLLSDGVLYVAITDTDNQLAERIVSRISGHQVVLVQAPADEIEATIDAAFSRGPALLFSPEDDGTPLRTGEVLASLGLVSEDDVEAALIEQARTGAHVGEILVANGLVNEDDLLAVLADQFRVQRVSLEGFEPDPAISDTLPETVANALRCVPVALEDGVLFLAVARPLDDHEISVIAKHTDHEIHELLATRSSIDLTLQRIYSEQYSTRATSALLVGAPEASARRVVTGAQKAFFISVTVAVLACLAIWPQMTLIVVVATLSAFYLAVSLYRFQIVYKALGGARFETDVTDEEIDALDERDLPIYTILIPLYREAAVVPALVKGIGGLDYPKTKLDVKLLCEEDDDETVPAIQKLNLPPHFKLVVVPDSQPKTKPKACNYGLAQAEGKYIVIFDAEDQPDTNQLKKAVAAFAKADPAVTCIQAKLNYFNQDQNLLTRWFASEYSMHFDLVLPGLDAANVPIPLGGTSNHFITERLRELGAWDPFNVTEDADLGIRLHRHGYTTAMMDSTTLEEANSDVANWLRQRSRWIKGYMQTWLVHMRNPLQLLREVGLKNFISFNLTVGGAFIFLINPIFWALTTVFALTQAGFIQSLFPGFIFYAAGAMLFIGNFVFVYLNVAGSMQRGYFELTKYCLISPFYWGLMSWSAWKGFIQLFTNPFYWEKTVHGLDNGESH